jgi:dipeptidase
MIDWVFVELACEAGGLVFQCTCMYARKCPPRTCSTMTSLANEYGYASEGESFSIGDPNEVWHMDLIGKGNFELGVVWVAIRAPEGYVGAHANQARITTWPRDDPDNVMWAEEIVDFAKTNGFYPESGKDEDFDFTAAFNPLVVRRLLSPSPRCFPRSPAPADACRARTCAAARRVCGRHSST